jgi:hypothetical protein
MPLGQIHVGTVVMDYIIEGMLNDWRRVFVLAWAVAGVALHYSGQKRLGALAFVTVLMFMINWNLWLLACVGYLWILVTVLASGWCLFAVGVSMQLRKQTLPTGKAVASYGVAVLVIGSIVWLILPYLMRYFDLW